MKKLLLSALIVFSTALSANAYQVLSSKELGQLDAKNQNVDVKTEAQNVDNNDKKMEEKVENAEVSADNVDNK